MKYSHIIFLLLFFLHSQSWMTQENDLDLKLANNYYVKGEYEKAIMYYEKISENKNSLKLIYNYYKNSLIELKKFKSAEKLCKDYIKNSPEKLSLFVDLGLIYGLNGNETKKNQQLDKAINEINSKSSFENISDLGLSFEKNNDLDRALLAYKTGESFNKANPYAFHDKIAFIYNKQGSTEAMVNTFLELLDQSELFLSSVQSGISRSIDFEFQLKEKEILRKLLLQKVQTNPQRVVYVKLLAWYYLTNNDYDNAYVQIKAIDKKLKKDGEELINLGETALNNSNFNIALKCFDQVIKNTESNERRFKAENLRLKSLKDKITYKNQASEDEVNELRNDYLQTLEQLNKSSDKFSISIRKYELLKELSVLEAYYLNDIKAAKIHTKQAMGIKEVKEKDLATLKLQFADFLVLEGNIWEASLMYMQVEKQFKNDPIGHIAKFKNAEVYYFSGEFDWCQAQLEVLKASTSKLIANDALELSVLITDNFNMDTSEHAMKLFASADMLKSQFKYYESIYVYDSILNKFNNHSLCDDILLRKAKVYVKMNLYDSAVNSLKILIEEYSSSILIDNALFLLGDIYENNFKDDSLAISYYKKILFDFPGSIYVTDARKRFRKLSGVTNENIKKDI